jgi:tRNA-Thr(GGU) m(6)t(6)A37 methyltransferase TsaA
MIELKPIGIIHTPFTKPEGMPIQGRGAAGIRGTIDLFDEYHAGLKDLEGFSHIILLYHFHRSQGFNLQVVPFMDSELRGLFATRAPKRPNQDIRTGWLGQARKTVSGRKSDDRFK